MLDVAALLQKMTGSQRRRASKLLKLLMESIMTEALRVLGAEDDFDKKQAKHTHLVEAVFEKLSNRKVEELLLELPAEMKTELGTGILAYLEFGAKPVLVRKGNKRFRVRAALIADNIDDYGKDPEILDDDEFNGYILPFLVFPDIVWLHRHLGDLNQAAQKLNLDWRDTERILRRIANKLLGNKDLGAAAEGLPEATEQAVTETMFVGERNQHVAARRAELRNMMRAKRSPKAQEICKRWDSSKISVPDAWVLDGIDSWQQALKVRRGNVHKIISLDKREIRGRSRTP